ncbi:hypothetical protein, partial [Hydrogenimonas sp.]
MLKGLDKRGVVLIALVLLALMGAGVWYLSSRVEQNRYSRFSDTIRTYFRDELRSQKSQALSLAIALAENKALKEALADDDEDRGFTILSASLARLREYTL